MARQESTQETEKCCKFCEISITCPPPPCCHITAHHGFLLPAPGLPALHAGHRMACHACMWSVNDGVAVGLTVHAVAHTVCMQLDTITRQVRCRTQTASHSRQYHPPYNHHKAKPHTQPDLHTRKREKKDEANTECNERKGQGIDSAAFHGTVVTHTRNHSPQ